MQGIAATLFLAFYQDFNRWKFDAGLYQRLKRLEEEENLPLVILCATGVHASVAENALKRIALPEFQRIYRLNIVMTVK
jgi:hypothetical protein